MYTFLIELPIYCLHDEETENFEKHNRTRKICLR